MCQCANEEMKEWILTHLGTTEFRFRQYYNVGFGNPTSQNKGFLDNLHLKSRAQVLETV